MRTERTVRYGAMTMVALCFANALQQGEGQAFSQATEGIKHAFHVSDFALGTVPFFMGLCGALGSVPVSLLSSKFKRTAVLAGMFATWTLLMGLNGLVLSFALFYAVRLMVSVTEATDPAALPLLADYYPVDQRAAKASIFNAGAGVGAFVGIILSGVLVDNFGWRWTFLMWVPFGVIGTLLIRSRPEPPRGAQDADFKDELGELSAEAAEAEAGEQALIAELVAGTLRPEEMTDADAVTFLDPEQATRWEIFRHIFKFPSWRRICIAVGVSQIMQNALMFWGPAYFKRTFGLSGTEVGALAPVLGLGSFAGLLGGGFLADRLLRRGVLLARVWVSGIGFAGAGVFLILAFSTRSFPVSCFFLAVGSLFGALPTGPFYAALLDVVPSTLRSQAASLANLVQFCSALGYPIVGALSTAFGNLRLAMLCASPIYLIGAGYLLMARQTYVEDVARVVADARRRTGQD